MALTTDADAGRSSGPAGPRTGFRLFRGALSLAYSFLALATVALVVLGALALTGRGTVVVDGRLDGPYAVAIGPSTGGAPGPDLRPRWEVSSGGFTGELANFPDGDARSVDVPSVTVDVHLDGDDTDARAVFLVGMAVCLALAWIVVLNLRGVAASVGQGDAFAPRNVARLRWVAAAILVFPVCIRVAERVLVRALDHPLPVSVDLRGPSWWVFALIGLGVLALAEVFGEGARLRDFERATV
jgi:hypothetical protein